MNGLTIKQEKLAREYVKSGNGTQAAIKAGYSKRSAQQIAHETLLIPVVSEAVKALRIRLAERLDISKEKLVNDVAHIAEQAHIDGDYGPAIKAKELILKAQGYLVDRQLNMNVDVTQQHLDALQHYTDQRIAEVKQELRAEQHNEGRDDRESVTIDAGSPDVQGDLS